MNDQKQKISVLMPVFNGEKYLAEAIESILRQTYRNFDFVIVDDCSTDQTAQILRKYAQQDERVKIFTTPKNLYISGALNFGLERAETDIVARMDADDIALPMRLEKQLAVLNSDRSLAIVGSDIELIDEMGGTLGIRKYPRTDEALKKTMFRYSPFAHPAVMYHKSMIQEFGAYLPVRTPSEDLNLWFRVGTKYKFATVPEVLLRYRYFADSSSNRKLRLVELKTLRIRIHAWLHQGYRPSFLDFAYNIAQATTMYLIPTAWRLRLFNLIRKYI